MYLFIYVCVIWKWFIMDFMEFMWVYGCDPEELVDITVP